MPNSLASQFTPRNVLIMTTKPSIFSIEAVSPFIESTLTACRYMAKTVHVMRDHVSFGSQLQYLPHASFAHPAPENTANVSSGNPKSTRLWEDFLNVSMEVSFMPRTSSKPRLMKGAAMRRLT